MSATANAAHLQSNRGFIAGHADFLRPPGFVLTSTDHLKCHLLMPFQTLKLAKWKRLDIFYSLLLLCRP